MKQQVNPALIAGAVALVALLIFGIYKLTLGSSTGGNISKDNAPSYAKAAQRGQTANMGDYYRKQQQDNQQRGANPAGQGGYGRPGMGGYGR